jgi:hypothetical protein
MHLAAEVQGSMFQCYGIVDVREGVLLQETVYLSQNKLL